MFALLRLLWQRANAQNVSFETPLGGQHTLSTQVIIPNYLVIYSLGWEHISIHPGLLVTLKCNDLGQVPMKYIMKLFISSIRSKKLTTKAKE